MRSSLEFEVRLQEFVELIKSGKRMDAVKHARKHLSSNDPEQLPLIQRGMGLLAFPADTNVEPYRYSQGLLEFIWTKGYSNFFINKLFDIPPDLLMAFTTKYLC